MGLIQAGVTEGHRTWVMVWCMLAADAIRRCDRLGEGSWILQDVRLGGVPHNYLATLIRTSRVLEGNSGERVEVARLLSLFVTADPLLVVTVTRLLPVASTTVMLEAAGQLGELTHDQLTIAHDLATDWLDGPAVLALEARIRSRG